MTFKYLQSLLTPVAGVLNVIGTSLENQAVTSLFESYFTNDILSLYNAVTTADEASQTVTVVADITAGTALSLDFAVLSKSSWLLQSDGSVEILLTIVVNDADWGIVDTFPVLEGSVFSEMAFQDPAFTLDSTAASTLPSDFRKSFGQYTSEPSVEDNLVKGLSLSTQGTFEGAAEDFTSLFSPPLQFDGPIETYFKRNPYLSEGWDGTLPPMQALPQLMLSLSEDSRSFTVSGYEFVFQLQVASVLGETAPAKGDALPGVLPVGMLAIRTEFNTDGISLPISAFLTIDSSNTLEFVAGEIPSTPVTPSQLTSLLGGAAMPPEVDGGVVLYKCSTWSQPL